MACIPLQILFGRMSKQFFQKRASINDKRLQLTTEVIESIRLIKLYAWEEVFLKILNQIRSKDLHQLLGSKIIQAIEGSISLSSGIVSCFLMFYLVFKYEDPSSLTIANMFSTLDIFLFLRQEVISSSGNGIAGLFEIKVVINRIITKFLVIISQFSLTLIKFIFITSIFLIRIIMGRKVFFQIRIKKILSFDFNSCVGDFIIQNKINNPYFKLVILNHLNQNIAIALINTKIFLKLEKNQKEDKDSQISKSNQLNDNNIFQPIGEIVLTDLSTFWKLDQPVLQKISTYIQQGELVAIIGSVSSGKTSLLSCLLKEMPYYTGEIKFKGKIAYVEQEPIILNMSLRDNIIFGLEFDQEKYEKVLNACNLNTDIEINGGSDQFEIGEKGSNLSGGQRTRIALARALYSDADIYLLDDPLSALDSNVSQQIFKNAIKNFLREKTVLFTTHSLDFIHQVNKVLVLENGQIIHQGQPHQLEIILDVLQSTTLKRRCVSLPTLTQKDSFDLQELVKLRSQKETKKLVQLQKDNLFGSLKSKIIELSSTRTQKKQKSQNKNLTKLISIQSLLEDNEEDSKVTYQTYKTYFGFCQFKLLYPICILLFMSNEVSYILFTQTLGLFDSKNIDQYDEYVVWLGIYSLAYFLILLQKRSLMNFLINDINFNLHQSMIFTTMRSKISYFDQTPVGSLTSRFSSDISQLDTNLSKSLQDTLEMICNSLTLVTSIILLNPYFIIVFVVSVLILTLFFKLAKNVLIQTKQFELNLQSTVYTFFNTTIQGIQPIKLYNQTNSFRQQFSHILDDFLRTSYSYWFTNRGFAMYIIFVTQISSIIGIFLAISINNDGANLGQTITFFISLGYKLQSGLRLRQLLSQNFFSKFCINILF